MHNFDTFLNLITTWISILLTCSFSFIIKDYFTLQFPKYSPGIL